MYKLRNKQSPLTSVKSLRSWETVWFLPNPRSRGDVARTISPSHAHPSNQKDLARHWHLRKKNEHNHFSLSWDHEHSWQLHSPTMTQTDKYAQETRRRHIAKSNTSFQSSRQQFMKALLPEWHGMASLEPWFCKFSQGCNLQGFLYSTIVPKKMSRYSASALDCLQLLQFNGFGCKFKSILGSSWPYFHNDFVQLQQMSSDTTWQALHCRLLNIDRIAALNLEGGYKLIAIQRARVVWS